MQDLWSYRECLFIEYLFFSEEDQFSFADVELLPPPELYADFF